jgi:Mg-chelatase subunit ChlD
MPGTLLVNTKIAQGPGYGAFFLMPEDNLANLMLENEEAIAADGSKQTVEPPDDPLVMIYPEEGSVLNSNPAALVDASWVTSEQLDGASEWIDFVRDDDQQRRFMESGFRPASGTGLSVDAEQFESWGLAAEPPAAAAAIDPGKLKPEVLNEIIGSWGSVKKPSIITFVVDTSGSMSESAGADATPLIDQARDGLYRVLDAMAGPDSAGQSSQVGLLTFSVDGKDYPHFLIEPAPLRTVQGEMTDAIEQMEPNGATALYDAVKRGIELTDAAPGDDGATRAVVVLSDGAATAGDACLDDLVTMAIGEERVTRYCGMRDGSGANPLDVPRSADGEVAPEDVRGDELRLDTDHDVQVFFLGFGDADVNIGRILAQATDAEYQGQTDEDLAALIEALSGYF